MAERLTLKRFVDQHDLAFPMFEDYRGAYNKKGYFIYLDERALSALTDHLTLAIAVGVCCEWIASNGYLGDFLGWYNIDYQVGETVDIRRGGIVFGFRRAVPAVHFKLRFL